MNVFLDSVSSQITCLNHIIDLLLNVLRKWWVHCTYMIVPAILYHYKCQIRTKKEYCCQVWAGAPHSEMTCLDKVQKRLRGLVVNGLFAIYRYITTNELLYHMKKDIDKLATSRHSCVST